ncbi:MAG: replicative DNA helicase [Bdellovibrionales bacterium]
MAFGNFGSNQSSSGVRVPPQNLEAEQSILGGLMLNPEAFDLIADRIDAEDFYSPGHQKIYSAIRDLHSKGKPVDLVTVTDQLQTRNEFEAVGGYVYLAQLLERTISSANILAYTQIVKEKALLRRLISTSTHIIEKAYTSEQDVQTIVDIAEGEILKVSDTKLHEGLVDSMQIVKDSIKRIEELYQRKEEITGIPTGFSLLDKMTSGFHPGQLVVIAARPSMGKTAFSINIASHAALRAKKSVAYFSLEMSKEDLMLRLLASEAKVHMGSLRNGRLQDSDWPRLIAAAGALSEAKLYVDDTAGVSPHEVRARARRLKAKGELDMIVIDYLQFMQLKQNRESRAVEVSEISRQLKSIAKELHVPVIALAQLNRAVEGRTDRRPMLSDLRESGSIEQDADIIMMLFREDYYDKEDPEKKGKSTVIIGKQRNGETGDVPLRFDGAYQRFRDVEPEPISPLPPPQAPPQYFGRPKNFAPGATI